MNNKNFRFPIVTIMGHVNHGKTSIIETISNKYNISSNEIGNITQSIKSYIINTKYGLINFIDTPGHDSFIKMRKLGAKITDIIILVISVDDGVKQQTIESINYIKEFEIPFIIVINKIDKGLENINTIKNDLLKNNIIIKEFGGDVNIIYISTKFKKGLNSLLKEIFNKSKSINLEISNKIEKTEAFILESYINNKKGVVIYSLIKNGYIKVGNYILCGNEYGKVKLIQDEYGNNFLKTNQSMSYYIFGLSKIPKFINKIYTSNNIKEIKKKISNNLIKYSNIINNNIYTLDNLKNKINNNLKINKLSYLIKSFDNGAYNAIKDSIDINIKDNDYYIKKINFKIGETININDINLALNTNSKFIGFNLKLNNDKLNLIKNSNIFFINYNLIHNIVNFIKNDINILLLEIKKNDYSSGLAEIKCIFVLSKNKSIIGCVIKKGIIKKNSSIKIFRKNILIYNGNIKTLRNLKKDVTYVTEGNECGISIKSNFIFKKKDIIMSN